MNEKTKLGVSVGFLAMVGYLLTAVSIWVVVGLMVVILLVETNAVVKRNIVQAVLLAVFFLIIDSVWSGLGQFFNLFRDLEWYTNTKAITALKDIFEMAVSILLGIMALNGAKINLPILSNIADLNIQKEE